MNASSSLLAGRRVLLVEDDFFVVEDMRLEFEAIGASVIGPAATVDDALRLVAATDRLDAAVLDVNLRGAMVYPVADALTAPTLMERAMGGDATAARQFLHQAGFTDKEGQWLPQYQPLTEDDLEQ